MQLTYEILTVHTTHPFIIARGGTDTWRTVWVTLRDKDGIEGWGEAAPSRFYGESTDTVVAALQQFAPVLERADSWSIETVERELNQLMRWNAAAKAAVSAALHDLMGKRLGIPVWKLWGLNPAEAPRSSFTIPIAPDEPTLRARVRDAAGYPILKIKLGSPRDREILRIVREEAPNAILRVDANAAWTPKGTLAMLDTLVACNVELLEQPLPPHDIAGFRFVRQHAPMPLVADESCLVAHDIPQLADAVDGINLKLMKCGSLREALRMIATARAHGLHVMCGCMIETTLGIAAAAHFAPLLDFADFDGAALLRDDPFTGPHINAATSLGTIQLSDAPGLGVQRRA
jgi:L-alanine-DL-glutamate epimerase-like enolase superfamily enzyme